MADSTVDATEDTTEETTEEVQETEVDEVDEQPEGDDEGADDDEGDDEEFDEARAKAKIKKTNREAENLRKRLKKEQEERAAEQAELQKYRDERKTDSEKLTERATGAEQKLVALQQEYDRMVIKNEFGLTDAQVKRLVGTNIDELREDAEQYVEENNIKGPGKKAAPRASEVTGGRTPKETANKPDPVALAAKIRRR